MTHASPSLDQTAFRGRNDDGSETTASWKAAANTNWTQAVDVNFRVRYVIAEVNGAGENNFNARHQYNLNGAGWNDITATSLVVRAVASANFADEDPTTQQLGSGSFVTGAMDENDGLAGAGNQIDFAGNDESEVEFCGQIRGVDVNGGDTIQTRVVRDGGALDAWSSIPTITANKPIVVPLSKAGFDYTAPTISTNAREIVALAAASLDYTPRTIAGLVLIVQALTAAGYDFTAPTLGTDQHELLELAAAAFGYTPRTIQAIGAEIVTLTKAGYDFSGPVISALEGNSATIKKAALGFTARPLSAEAMIFLGSITFIPVWDPILDVMDDPIDSDWEHG